MADLPPRLAGQPPPLPTSFPPSEPFPPDDRAPDTLRLGTPPPRATILPPPIDPLTETTAALLRQELALTREVFREALPTVPALPNLEGALVAPEPSVRTQTRSALRRTLGVGLAAALGTLLTILGGVAAKRWPAYSDVINWAVQLGGGGPDSGGGPP